MASARFSHEVVTLLMVITELIKVVEQEFVRGTELGGVVCISSLLLLTYADMSLERVWCVLASLPSTAEV